MKNILTTKMWQLNFDHHFSNQFFFPRIFFEFFTTKIWSPMDYLAGTSMSLGIGNKSTQLQSCANFNLGKKAIVKMVVELQSPHLNNQDL